MPSRAQRTGSLATQISVSTLGLVTLTVLLASVLALGGVYNLARQETAARLQAFRDILLDDLTARFVVADLVVDSATTAVRSAGSSEDARDSLYRLASANTEYFDVVLIADPAGDVVAAWPPTAVSESVAGEAYLDAPNTRGSRLLTWQPMDEDVSSDEGRVWITERVSRDGDVVAARLRIGFVGLLVDEIASREERRLAFVVDAQGRVIERGQGGGRIETDVIEWSTGEDDSEAGTVAFHSASLGEYEGFFAVVEESGDLGWRVAVLEPSSVALERTQDALLPASLTVAAAALVAMWASYLFGRRLAAPLRLLEARAREVAAGAYIQPIDVEREDEVGRLASAFNDMASRLNALQDLSQLLASASELDQVLDSILSAMEHILGTGRSAIFMADEDGRDLRLVKSSGTRVKHPDVTVPVAGVSWVSQAYRTGRSVAFVMSPDDALYDPVAGLYSTEDSNSGLALPLSIGHEPFGVVLVVSSGRQPLTEAEVEMARAFSAQAAIAVQNSRLFEEEHASRKEAEALRDMAALLAGPKGIEDTLDEVGAIAAELLRTDGHHLAMSDKDRRELDVGPSAHPESDSRYLQMWSGVAASHPERAPEEPIPVEELRHDPLYSDLARERGVESVVMIPMMQGAITRGVLVLECRTLERTFSQRDINAAYATGKTIAVALESNVLFNQARKRAENLEMVFRISQAVSLSLQTTVVLNRVMDVVQKMVPSPGVALMQYDSRRGVLATAMVRGIEDKRVLLAELQPGEDIPGKAFESRQPVAVHDLDRVETPLGVLVRDLGFRSWLCAPLLARGRSIGVLSVWALEPHAFTEEDTELVSTFAAQAALALDTAAMFEREHKVASVLQSSIVPDVLPPIPWLETASTYQPAGSESEIGGDYYDLFLSPAGSLVMAIGDVCGKGVQAATKTSVIKYTLRGLVSAGLGPAQALSELNSVVAETGDVADIVTMWVGFLEPYSGRLDFANAGHPPALLRAMDGEILSLGPTGPLLGAIDDVVYDSREVTLMPGTTLSMYTDGVTEARGPEGLFGEARLLSVVADGGSAQEIVDRVVASVRGFTDGVLRDDVAMLVVRYRPEPAGGYGFVAREPLGTDTKNESA